MICMKGLLCTCHVCTSFVHCQSDFKNMYVADGRGAALGGGGGTKKKKKNRQLAE